jgi:hypothetical protein
MRSRRLSQTMPGKHAQPIADYTCSLSLLVSPLALPATRSVSACGFSNNGGVAVGAQFSQSNGGLMGVAVAGDATLYIADAGNGLLRKASARVRACRVSAGVPTRAASSSAGDP